MWFCCHRLTVCDANSCGFRHGVTFRSNRHVQVTTARGWHCARWRDGQSGRSGPQSWFWFASLMPMQVNTERSIIASLCRVYYKPVIFRLEWCKAPRWLEISQLRFEQVKFEQLGRPQKGCSARTHLGAMTRQIDRHSRAFSPADCVPVGRFWQGI